MALEIPTYDGLKHVMYYDVLLKLALQATKLFHQKDNVKKLQRELKTLRAFKGKTKADDDTLEALYNNDLKLQDYDIDFDKLVGLMKEHNPKIELVKDLIAKNKQLNKKYNHKVDTNFKLMVNRERDNEETYQTVNEEKARAKGENPQ